MRFYSQKDPKWANNILGYCKNAKFKNNACYLTCLSMLSGIDPVELNRRFKVAGVYVNGCLINSKKASKELKTTYNWSEINPKRKYPVIAETNHYKRVGYPQHFCILLPDGRRVDPLDLNPKPETNNYNIISYRDFGDFGKTKTMDKIKKTKKAIKKYVYDFGSRINSKEDQKIAEQIKKLYEWKNELITKLMNEQAKPRITYKQEFNQCMDKLKQCRVDYEAVVTGSELKEEESKRLKQRIENQSKEIKSLKALNEKNAKDSSLWQSFVFLIKTAIK